MMGDVQFFGDAVATIAGINIGGTTTTVVGGHPDGTILSRWSTPTPALDGELLIRSVTEAVRFVAPHAERIGVAVGGTVRRRARHRHRSAASSGFAEPPAPRPSRGRTSCACRRASRCGGVRARRMALGSGCRPRSRVPHVRHRIRHRFDHRWPRALRRRRAQPRDRSRPLPGRWAVDLRQAGMLRGLRLGECPRAACRLARAGGYRGATPLHVVNEAREGEPTARWALRENERAVGSACALLADLLGFDLIVLGTLAVYLGPSWIDA